MAASYAEIERLSESIPVPEYTGDLIKAINPDMNPVEVLARLVLHTKVGYSGIPDEVERGRRQLILNAGYEPDDWVWYTNDFILDNQTYDDMVQQVRKPFPQGIDFLVVPGAMIGGGTTSSSFQTENGTIEMQGFAMTVYRPTQYTVFVRLSEE